MFSVALAISVSVQAQANAPIVVKPEPTYLAPPAPPPPPPPGSKEVGARPLVPLARLFTADDYPVAAMRNGEQGTVSYRLTISPDGRVSGCGISGSSGSAILDGATCTILQRRARFRPARDRKGRPIADYFSGRARWAIPPQPPRPVANSQYRFILSIGQGRTIATCRFEAIAQVAKSESDRCPRSPEMAGHMLKALPASTKVIDRELVIETQIIVGAGDLGNDVGLGAGQTVLRRDRAMLTIDAEGQAIACTQETRGALRPVGEFTMCKQLTAGRYEPLPAEATNRNPRDLAVVQVAYLRPAAPSR